MELLAKTDVGRDINRHYYKGEEVAEALETPMVTALTKLIRFRNEHPAFDGTFSIVQPARAQLEMTWKAEGQWAKLSVDFAQMEATISHTTPDGTERFPIKP